ncbi:MAG: hypothetical protein HYY10_03765 [Candidatus Liptonbacteria bacterium]|nr:hypothetical protein [Candidatus Liptonbacteria bacterium]
MNIRSLVKATGVVFGVIALAHLVRAALRWEMSFAGRSVPVWVSVLIVVLSGYLAYESFRKRGTHYMCTGGCGGVSPKPGVCQAEGCAKKGMPLMETSL